MVLDPLSLGPKLYDTVHDPIPVGPLVWGWTHFKAQVELKYHNESVRDMASGPLDLGLYGIWPQAHWASTRTITKTKTEPKPHSKSTSFWIHNRQTHVWSFMTCSGVHSLRIAHVLGSSVFPWGVSLPGDLFEAEISSNAITTISNGAYSLSGIIKLDPTHTSETKM